MSEPGRNVIDRPRRAHRAVLLLLVALSAVAGWIVAPSGGAVVRSGASVTGPVVKPVGTTVARATRGPVAAMLARATQQVTAAPRATAEETPGIHGGGLLAVLGALVALFVTGRRSSRLRSVGSMPTDVLLRLGGGRAPPAGRPIPA